MSEVIMPRLSDSMEEGTIVKWLKANGDAVTRGEPLVEIETDKATITHEADATGVLEIFAHEGNTISVGKVIAAIGRGTEAVGKNVSSAANDSAPTKVRAVGSPATLPYARDSNRLNVSPVAVRLAQERGVDLAVVRGSGPAGRIVKSDVEAAAAELAAKHQGAAPPTDRVGPPAHAAPLPSLAAVPALVDSDMGAAKGEVTLQDATRQQQVIARRMAESDASIPDFSLQVEIDMEGCIALRAETRELGLGNLPTYNDMVVKACALALHEFPQANGTYRDGRFELHSRVNVGVAVAAQDVLVVPTVFDADTKPLLTVARETQVLADRARKGTITPAELSGGTFTVSNLGMYGVRAFTAIINPPQAAILSVGSLEPRAVVRNGEIVARHTVGVTLACDHRIIYGAEAAEFLARIRALLEQPVALTV